MFLVILRCTMDDIPLHLFGDRGSAVEYAETVSDELDEGVRVIIDVDCSDTCAVAIAGFAATGQIESYEVVKTFD